MAAPACLFRAPGRDRLDAVVIRAFRRIRAFADRSDCGAFFKTARFGLPVARAAARWPHRAERRTELRRTPPARSRRGRGAMRPGRCLPAMIWRASIENRDAGARIGGGLDSPRPSHNNSAQPIPARSAEGVSRRRTVSDRRSHGFPAVRPRRREHDVTAPATRRVDDAARHAARQARAAATRGGTIARHESGEG
jgi:hypothetical protein